MRRLICLAMASLAVALGGCVSVGPARDEPNYVKAQIYQTPGVYDDRYGTDALPGEMGVR